MSCWIHYKLPSFSFQNPHIPLETSFSRLTTRKGFDSGRGSGLWLEPHILEPSIQKFFLRIESVLVMTSNQYTFKRYLSMFI